MASLRLPTADGTLASYVPRAHAPWPGPTANPAFNRVAFAAAHVVASPLADNDPWLDTAVDWVERIPFTETRDYVQRVMENYQVYKMLLDQKADIVADITAGR